MPTITIDNHTYDLDTLTDDARAQLQSLQFVDAELARLQAQAAVLQTPHGVFQSVASGVAGAAGGRRDEVQLSAIADSHFVPVAYTLRQCLPY